MTDLYLIAHKVRGAPAFDVAERVECPECHSLGHKDDGTPCFECDECGYWWTIPTSGHRAYAYAYVLLTCVNPERLADMQSAMPDMWPDHYPHRAEPSRPKLDVSALIPKSAPIRRRV
jgi:hypothetical protein